MLRKGYGGLYKAPGKEERRKRTAKRRETRSSLLILDLKDGIYTTYTVYITTTPSLGKPHLPQIATFHPFSELC